MEQETYLSRREPESVPLPRSPASKSAPPAAAVPKIQRFPLTAFDAQDTVEAPSLAADAAGRIYLAWASKTGTAERTVFLTASAERGASFEAPLAISQAGLYLSGARTGGKTAGHERRATPQVAVVGAAVHLAWSEALPEGKGIRMVLATSNDDGRTFALKQPVHQDPLANATFVAMAADPRGAIACAWLDGRAGSQQPYAAVRRPGTESFEKECLLHAGDDGKGVCPCCAMATCIAPDGTVFAAFRNVQDGYRDIFISRLRPGQSTFEGPFPVTANTWKFKGCPHDGPSLAVVGDALHVVWMDAHTGPSRCYHARAALVDLKFETKPLHAAGPGAQGNAKLCNDADGGLHVVWEESLGAAKEDAGASALCAPTAGRHARRGPRDSIRLPRSGTDGVRSRQSAGREARRVSESADHRQHIGRRFVDGME